MESVLKYESVTEAVAKASDLGHLLRLLHWLGILKHAETSQGVTRAFYLRSVTFAVCMLMFLCSQLAFVYKEGTADLVLFTMAISCSNTTAIWVFRLAHAILHQHDFQYLAFQVKRDFAQFARPPDVAFLEARDRTLRRVMNVYLWIGFASAFWWLISSAIRFGFSVEGLPYHMVLPYDVSRPLNFIATLLFCSCMTEEITITTMVFDCLNIHLMVQLQLQLVILSRHLYDIPKALKQSKTSKTEMLDDTQIFPLIRRSILHHQTIIRNALLLEKCLSGMLLGQITSVGAVVCLQLYQIATSSRTLSELGTFGSYIYLMTAELFMYCWFGDDMIPKSENISMAAYSSAASLSGCSVTLQRSLLIIMTRAQRPLRITAGGLFVVSRESFVAVVNMSYSFFAILRNFKDE